MGDRSGPVVDHPLGECPRNEPHAVAPRTQQFDLAVEDPQAIDSFRSIPGYLPAFHKGAGFFISGYSRSVRVQTRQRGRWPLA
jgi:hypothetical protein